MSCETACNDVHWAVQGHSRSFYFYTDRMSIASSNVLYESGDVPEFHLVLMPDMRLREFSLPATVEQCGKKSGCQLCENLQILIVTAIKICKQRLQTASTSG